MLDRLLGTIYLLMNKGTVTASELAERFEVSVRTVYRDVETLSIAGIPIYTKKGKNGGICLTERFVLDKLMVSRQEQLQILAALESLKETGAQEEQETLRKLGDFFQIKPQSWVAIDFSDWSGRRRELFEQLRQALWNSRVIEFDYYGQYGKMSHRTVEPIQLLFKDYTWYLRAYCRERKAMRLFKILRMKRVAVKEDLFQPREDCWTEERTVTEDTDTFSHIDVASAEQTRIELRIDASEAYRIYDRFEEDEISVQEDGNFLIQMDCKLDDWIYGMILSFGPSAEVLGPEQVRREMRQRLKRTLNKYGYGGAW